MLAKTALKSPIRQLQTGLWFAIPQIASRLSSFAIFGLLAHYNDAQGMGVFAVASAITSGAAGLAPAIVGKPLANMRTDADLASTARRAHSGAILLSLLASLLLVALACLANAQYATAMLLSAVGLPAAMCIEAGFWRISFTRGAKVAGPTLGAAYICQLLVVIVASQAIATEQLLWAPFIGLAISAFMAVGVTGRPDIHGAFAWLFRSWAKWSSYVAAAASSLVVALVTPTLLAATVSFSAAATYRAAEIAFGLVNVLIGITSQMLLTGPAGKPQQAARVLGWTTACLSAVSIFNGLVLELLPANVVSGLFGSVTGGLTAVVLVFAIQRAALSASSAGSSILVPHLSSARYGAISAITSLATIMLLVVGGLIGELAGAVAGLTAAEILTALVFFRCLKKAAT
jgi:hypothetical protein